MRFIVVCLAAGIAVIIARVSVQAAPGPELPPIVFTAAQSYDALAWMRGGERFPDGATIMISDAKGKRPLVPDFASSADPDLSFDAQKLLFAGKQKSGDPWQIWEFPLSGGEARRITSGNQDCIRPFYLPDNRIVYSRKVAGRFVVETSDMAGAQTLALTYGPANFLPSDVLRDGRVLFEAGYPLGSDATPEIYTVYPDGSGMESYRCDHGASHHQGRQIGSGDILFVSTAGLSRYTSSRAQEVRIPAPKGEYAGDVVELPTGEWLLPWRPDANLPFQMAIWKPGSSQLRAVSTVGAPCPVLSSSKGLAEVARHGNPCPESRTNELQPTVFAERTAPNRFPSGLHDWDNANLLCLNAYTSKYQFSSGTIHQVRFYSRDGEGKPKLLGTAPVETDGSFFVQVPTEQPLQVELVDASGKTLKREAGYFWMRRGEQRACVGCHAGPETSPENAVPQILLRSTTPTNMTGAPSAAGGH